MMTTKIMLKTINSNRKIKLLLKDDCNVKKFQQIQFCRPNKIAPITQTRFHYLDKNSNLDKTRSERLTTYAFWPVNKMHVMLYITNLLIP